MRGAAPARPRCRFSALSPSVPLSHLASIPSAWSALGLVCPGCCGLLTRAAPVRLWLSPPAAFTLLTIFLCLRLQLLPWCPAPYPAFTSLNDHCLLRLSSPGPNPTPTSAPSQGKDLGRGEGRNSRWPDHRLCASGTLEVESIPTWLEFSKNVFERVTSMHTKHRKTHSQASIYMYLSIAYTHTIIV